MNYSFNHKRYVFLIVALTFFLSLMIRLEYRKHLSINNPFRGDAYYYLSYGYNIAVHHTFSRVPTFNRNITPIPDAFSPPGFPFMIATSISIGNYLGVSFYHVLTMLNAVFGAMIAPMTLIASMYILPVWASFFVALLTVASPHILSIGGYVLTENLFSFFLIASLLFIIYALTKNRLYFWGFSGLFFGLAYLTNPVILFLPFIIGAIYAYRENNFSPFKNWGKNILIFMSVFLLIIGAWHARNIISVENSSSKSSNRAAINLINGLYPDYYDSYKKGDAFKPDYPMNIDIKRANGSVGKALEIIREKVLLYPSKYLKWYFFEKPLLFWSWDIGIGEGDIYVYRVNSSLFTISPFWDGVRKTYKYFNTAILLMVIAGIVLSGFRLKGGLSAFISTLVYVILIYSTFIYSVFQSDPRYSIPFKPEFYMALVSFIVMIINRRRKRPNN